jgi:hypothetical protein
MLWSFYLGYSRRAIFRMDVQIHNQLAACIVCYDRGGYG